MKFINIDGLFIKLSSIDSVGSVFKHRIIDKPLSGVTTVNSVYCFPVILNGTKFTVGDKKDWDEKEAKYYHDLVLKALKIEE